MLQGESHVSRDPILLLGNIIYAPCHVSLNVRIKVKIYIYIYNSPYCELGSPVAGKLNIGHTHLLENLYECYAGWKFMLQRWF